MKGQRDIFGKADGLESNVFDYISSRCYEGSTPSEVAEALKEKPAEIKAIVGTLLVKKKIVLCGERKATVRARKKIESVYKAARFMTQPPPKKKEKKKDRSTENIKVKEVPYVEAKSSRCPVCGADVSIVTTVYGEEICDPQLRYLILEEDGEGLCGFEEDTGKYVSGRSAKKEEALLIRHTNKCGKPWTVIKKAHYESCTGPVDEWIKIWKKKESEADIEWETIEEAVKEAVGCKDADMQQTGRALREC